MPKKVGTTQWRKQRRKEYLEQKEYRYYIFCEGERTEPLYFEGFKQLIEDIFIDIRGWYLGEIVDRNRLLYRNNSEYKSENYGSYGNYGNVGSYGNYGNIGSCSYAGYSDIKIL